MKLARFSSGSKSRIGRVIDDKIVDLGAALPGIGDSMRTLITRFDEFRDAIAAVNEPGVPLADVHLLAPINDPQKYLAIGMNYKAHAEEAIRAGAPPTTSQAWFNKQVSCINGPYDAIDMPRVSEQLDYEGEFAYVIGRRCRDVKASEAYSVVFGYMIANDVSVRDWQRASPTATLGKSFDTHGPTGPWLTLTDEIDQPYALSLRTLVNGELRQRSALSDQIFNIGAQLEYLSTVMTLEPGDIISTGTPAGVGLPTGNWLKVGDKVRVEIDKLGYIENQVAPQR